MVRQLIFGYVYITMTLEKTGEGGMGEESHEQHQYSLYKCYLIYTTEFKYTLEETLRIMNMDEKMMEDLKQKFDSKLNESR